MKNPSSVSGVSRISVIYFTSYWRSYNETTQKVEENERNINERENIVRDGFQCGLHRVSLVPHLVPRPLGLFRLRAGLVPLPDCVEEDVDQNDEKREYETEEKPDIHYLNGGGGRQAVGH